MKTVTSLGSAAEVAENEQAPQIAIVGMGFAGTATAIRLMQLASTKLRLLLIEQESCQAFGGLAYGSSTLLREHYLNIHAGRISLYRERPDDFLKWAAEDADPRALIDALGLTDPDDILAWKERLSFTESSPVPRIIYQLYLRDRFRDALTLSQELIEVEWVRARVDDLEEFDNHTRLYFHSDPVPWYRDVQVAVLCTGHITPILPEASNRAKTHHAFFASPYSTTFLPGISKSSKTDSLLIIGSGLSAFDAAISALSVGFAGKITMCSSHGFTHAAYPNDHSHAIIPSVFDDLFTSVRTAEQMTKAVKQAITRAQTDLYDKYFNDEDRSVIPERVLKAIEPQVVTFVKTALISEVRLFLRNRSWITTMRTSVVPIVLQRVREAGITELRKSIKYIDVTSLMSFDVALLDDPISAPTTDQFTHIVCCMGYDPDYSHPNGLWGHLVDRRLAFPHEKTGLGIQVGNNGRMAVVAGDSRKLSRSLYAVGTMRQGDEIQRRGRLGAFTFSIGTIRNQCLMSALSVLKHIELPEYRETNREERESIKRRIEDMLGATGTLRRDYVLLVSRVAEASFLPHTPGRDRWVDKLRSDLHKLCTFSFADPIERRLFLHELWHGVRIRAGRLVTDISRLSDRYQIVREYGRGQQKRCLSEKKECKDHLKRLMDLFEAESASLSVDSEVDKCLRPFVNYLRVNKLSSTAYGEYNAGRLVRAYCEQIDEHTLQSHLEFFPGGDVLPYFDATGRMIGMVIPDYNETTGRKPTFDDTPRIYPHLLVTLIVDPANQRVLGVLYLEAFKGRFKPANVGEVFDENRGLVSAMSRVADEWEPSQDASYQDHVFADGTMFDEIDLSGVNFKGARMRGARVFGTKMNGAILNGADCSGSSFVGSEMRGALLFGTIFSGASFVGADLSSCEVYGAKFDRARFGENTVLSGTIEQSDFSHAIFDGSKISGAKLRNVNLSNAKINNVEMIGVTFDACKWDNTKLSGCTVDTMTFQCLPDDIREKYEDTFKWNRSSDGNGDEPLNILDDEGLETMSLDDESKGDPPELVSHIQDQVSDSVLTLNESNRLLKWRGMTASFQDKRGNNLAAWYIVKHLYDCWVNPQKRGQPIRIADSPGPNDAESASVAKQVRKAEQIVKAGFGDEGPKLIVDGSKTAYFLVPTFLNPEN